MHGNIARPFYKLSPRDLDSIIKQTLEVEASNDYKVQKNVFSPLWDDVSTDPDFSIYSAQYQAELYFLAGKFLIRFGKSKASKNCQFRGIILIDKAISIFSQMNQIHRVKECEIMKGFGYFQLGEIEQFEKYLVQAENFYRNNKSHQNYLLTQISFIQIEYLLEQTLKAERRIKLIEKAVSEFGDNRTKAQFYNWAGIIYRVLKKPVLSEEYNLKSIFFAKKLHNRLFAAQSLNNLAFLFCQNGRSKEAFKHSNEAIEIVSKLDYEGHLAVFLDTLAQINYALGDFVAAHKNINLSLYHFRDGDEHFAKAEAYWLKVRILYKLRKPDDAKEIFNDLLSFITEKNLGQIKAIYYKNALKEFLNKPLSVITKFHFSNVNFKGSQFKSLNSELIVHYLVPAYISEKVFQINSDLIIFTTKGSVVSGDIIIFRSNEILMLGSAVHIERDEWAVNIKATGKQIPFGAIKNPRKVIGYNLKSEFVEDAETEHLAMNKISNE